MTLEERKEKVKKLRAEGYNCAQAVVMAFSDLTGLDDATAAATAAGLGGGVGGMKEICGVVTGMTIAYGLITRAPASEKAKVYAQVRELASRFKDLNSGRMLCRELKTPGVAKSCNALIEEGVEILHHHCTID